MHYISKSRLRGLVFAGVLLSAPAAAQVDDDDPTLPRRVSTSASFSPLIEPRDAIRPASTPISVDGKLDDAAWRNAMVVTHFSEVYPGDRSKPPIRMEARLTYDKSNLYVAFKVFDDPNRVRRSLTDRDNIWQDDYVGITLDTYGNNGWAYFLASNPIGVQGDTRIITGGEEDESFDIVFESEGRLTDCGYQVEMAVPFRSLRFPGTDPLTWNVNFWITHPRDSRRQYTWAAIDRNNSCYLCQSGEVYGFEEIGVGNGLELLPAVVGAQAAGLTAAEDPSSSFEADPIRIEPSLGLKYAINANLVGDFTLNPDFSQVEADAAQINVNEPFALFFPERRPFFQEGSDLYETPIQVAYTRSINDPEVAGKLTGRSGRIGSGYLGAVDNDSPIILPFEESSAIVDGGRSLSNIGRFKRSFGESNFVGGLLTDRRFESGGSGTTVGIDGLYHFSDSYQFSWQLSGSQTVEPDDPTTTDDLDVDPSFNYGKRTVAFDGESFSGSAARLRITRDSRTWSGGVTYETISPEYRAANGFVTQSNRNSFLTYQNYSWWPESGIFEQIRPHTSFGYEWDYSGQRRDIYYWLGGLTRMKGQTMAVISAMLYSNEVFKGIDFRDMQKVWIFLESSPVHEFSFSIQAEVGEFIAKGEAVPVLGTGIDGHAELTIRPIAQLSIEPRIAFSQLRHPTTGEDIFRGYISRLRTDFQFSRRLFFRLVTQYNQFNSRLEVDPLLTYRVNPYTAFFIGSTHDWEEFDAFDNHTSRFTPTSRQVFFKVQYLVRK